MINRETRLLMTVAVGLVMLGGLWGVKKLREPAMTRQRVPYPEVTLVVLGDKQ